MVLFLKILLDAIIEVDQNIGSRVFVDFGIPRPRIREVLLRSVPGSNSGVSHVRVLAFSNSNILDGCKRFEVNKLWHCLMEETKRSRRY